MAAIHTMELSVMALAHSLGFPRIGRDRELKKAQEAFWKGELDEAGLRAVGRELRQAHWALQKDAGIELLPVGDFAWYDQVLTHSLMFGVIPSVSVRRTARPPCRPCSAWLAVSATTAAAVPMPRR